MSAAPSVGNGFVRACALSEVAPESAIAVEIDGNDIAIVHSNGEVYAIADECSHAAIPLSEGDVGDGEVECYLHGSRFDLATGKPLGLPATESRLARARHHRGEDLSARLVADPMAEIAPRSHVLNRGGLGVTSPLDRP